MTMSVDKYVLPIVIKAKKDKKDILTNLSPKN